MYGLEYWIGVPVVQILAAVFVATFSLGAFLVLDSIITAGHERKARRAERDAMLAMLARDAGTFRPDGLRPAPRSMARAVRRQYLETAIRDRATVDASLDRGFRRGGQAPKH